MLCYPKLRRNIKSIVLNFLHDQNTIGLGIINERTGFSQPVKYLIIINEISTFNVK